MASTNIDTPLGTLFVETSELGLSRLLFGRRQCPQTKSLNRDGKMLDRAVKELRNYFDGDLGAFAKLPLDMNGTAFQQKVWKQLTKIRPGQTKTYGEIARAVNSPKAARAVGMACKNNPICLVVPCHRVVGESGKLTGFAGGLKKKAFLLKHEKAIEGEI